MDNKSIKDLKECPKCGDKFGYYTRVKSRLDYHDTTTFSGEKENTEMMDSQRITWESKYYYCYKCNKRIGKVE